MDRLSKYTLIFIIILIFIYNFTNNKYNNNDTILSNKQSILFEITELILMIILIIYCYINKYYINGFMLCSAFIEHILQLYYCYRQTGGGLKNIITATIYIILILYNYFKNNKIFILIWLLGLIIHLISLITQKAFTKIICLK